MLDDKEIKLIEGYVIGFLSKNEKDYIENKIKTDAKYSQKHQELLILKKALSRIKLSSKIRKNIKKNILEKEGKIFDFETEIIQDNNNVIDKNQHNHSLYNKVSKINSNNNFLFFLNKFKFSAASIFIFLIFTSVLFFLNDSKNDNLFRSPTFKQDIKYYSPGIDSISPDTIRKK